MSRSSRAGVSLAAISLLTICVGCASVPEPPRPEPLGRDLPALPAGLLEETAVPQLRVGDDARAKLAVTRDALKSCNFDKANGRRWYEEVLGRHAKGKR